MPDVCHDVARLSSRIASLLVLACVVLVGKPLLAQEDPSGEWESKFHEDRMERGPGPEIGDYTGIPLNNGARFHADAYEAGIIGLAENTCKQNSADHAWRDPALLRISKEVDHDTQEVIAFHTHISMLAPEQTIYMDGRPHPPEYAPHATQGFSTGKWEGDILAFTTDHLKEGLIRWNGIPRSDKATLSTHLLRHENYLTVALAIYDPVYLTEPLVRTIDFAYVPQQEIAPYPCDAVSETDLPEGTVPSHMPGTNEFLNEFPAKYGIPPEAARGGADTMYPEYIDKLKTMKRLPRPAAPKPAAGK